MTLRDAATVILVRQAAGTDPFEVFMVRRHHGMDFMAGAYVFPGGKLDGADRAPALLARCRGTTAERLEATPGRLFDAGTAQALCVAALRELFEEAGVLLARRRGRGVLLALDDGGWEALGAARARLNQGALTFADIVAAHDLELDTAALHYVGHWVTPSVEPRRFDARFFLAVLPPGQVAAIGTTEHTEQAWLAPRRAVREHEAGKLLLPPPTLAMLLGLAEAKSVAQLLARAAEQQVLPVMPKIASVGDAPAVLFPWDPLYEGAPGEALPPAPHDPGIVGGVSRVVLRKGVWRAERGGTAP